MIDKDRLREAFNAVEKDSLFIQYSKFKIVIKYNDVYVMNNSQLQCYYVNGDSLVPVPEDIGPPSESVVDYILVGYVS